MNVEKITFTPEQYAVAMEYEYDGMINALRYLCQEAEDADLGLVRLHLDIAIAELKEYYKATESDLTTAK